MKLRNFQYRIYPTGRQTRQLETVLETCRRLWNYFLEQKETAYKATKKSISYFEQKREIPSLVLKDEVLREVYSQTLQDVPKRLDKAFQAFFRRIKQGEEPGFPRFKGKGRYNSFTYPQHNGSFKLSADAARIYLSKIGNVKIAYHRPALGTWKTCVVKKTATGKWYVVISTEQPNALVVKSTKPAVGIDLGLETFATFSDGFEIKRERFFKTEQDALAKAQRKLDKQKKATLARRKAKKVVARVHERTANKRSNFTHKWSKIVANKYGVICMEDLNIKSMLAQETIVIKGEKKSAKPIHRSIADVAWNQFVNQTKYKAEDAGALSVLVNPKGTTYICRGCKKVVMKDLSQRIHKCDCGIEEPRDFNSGCNILAVGLHSLDALKKAS